MALRLGISSSMLPNFRGRLCLQRSFSPPALSRNRVCVQFPSETVSSCQRCQPGGSPRPQASRASVSAAAGESYSNSLQCRSCDDADELGTSGRKHDDWLRSGGGLCSQGFADGRLQDVLRESDIHFAGTETPCHCPAENSSNYQRSFIPAVQSCTRLNCELSERSFQTRNDKAVQDALSQQDWLSLASSSFSGSWIGYPGHSMSSRSNISCNCFCNHDMGWFCGAGCWGIRKLPRHKSHVPSKASPMSVAGWLSAAGHSSGAKSLRSAPKMSGSASSHLTSPTADHPSCESSKDLASAAGLLSLGSQEALLWGRGDYERPGDACTRQDEQQESELGSGSVKLAAKESQGFDESTQRQGRAFARSNEGSGSEENAKGTVRTGASQFVVGEEPVVAETQMEAAVMKALECSLGSPLGRESQLPPPKPLVIVISGPSGVGKDVVIKKLQEQRNSLHFVVTATTRPQRPGEVEGHDYFFVSKEKFQSMIDGGELLEHAVVYGDFKGIPKQQVRDCMAKGTDVVLRVDVQGAATVRSILGENAVFIFLVAESEASLVKRLITRKTETLDKVVLRVATAREELKRLDEFDYAVVNADGQLDTTVSSICSIIDAEKSRVQQRTAVL